MIVITRIWDCFTRIEKAILLGCFAALTYFAGGFFGMQQSAEALPPIFEAAPGAKALPNSRGASAAISIHVAGEVNKPGVLRVPENARIQEILKLAGGAVHSRKLPTPRPRSLPRAALSALRAGPPSQSAASSACSSTAEKSPLS